MCRIGIIGIENSHSNHFLRHLNADDAQALVRLAAGAIGSISVTEQIRNAA